MGSTAGADRRVGGRRWSRRGLLARPPRGARHAVPREAHDEAVRPGRQRQPAPLRPRLQDRDVAGHEENPFHTEVGYWLWDAATGEVLRGFVVPRGITVLAGGTAAADATEFTLQRQARRHRTTASARTSTSPKNASTISYEVTITTERRQLVLRRDDHAAHEGVPRALRAHRPQHVEASRLSRIRSGAPPALVREPQCRGLGTIEPGVRRSRAIAIVGVRFVETERGAAAETRARVPAA